MKQTPSIRSLTLLLALALNASPALAQEPSKPAAVNANPLLTESTRPYLLPPFDLIKDEHYAPAFAEGMAAQMKEVEAIATSKEKPTFENTVVALERSGETLERVQSVFSGLNAANATPEMQKLEAEIAPKLSAHSDAILLNAALFARIQTLYDARKKLALDSESDRLLERYYKDFVRAGAKVTEANKTKLKAINAELAAAQIVFEQHLLKERNASSVVVDDRSELAGLPDGEIAAAAAAAKEDGKEGKFLFAIVNTSGQPSTTSMENRKLRERIMQASLSRNSKGGEFDTREVLQKIARLRAEQALLLGFPTHAAYQLDEQTAKTVPTVNKLLADLAPPAIKNAKREAADMQAIIDQEHGGFQLAAGDWNYYAEKVRKAKYAFDESQLRPYLELNHVLMDGVLFAATQLYGITFNERKDIPVYDPDVRVFEVMDSDGKPLALFLSDPYARASKRGGAWAHEYVSQSTLLGRKPAVGLHLNIPKPSPGEPALLTYNEVNVAYHEFGHVLHAMFSNVKYPRFAGTNTPNDFVEYPSQVNEMWGLWPEVIKNYAKHYQTGEPMPAALVDKVIGTSKFNQGFRTTEYLSASILDQAWHQLKPDQIPKDVLAFEAEVLKKAGVDFAPVPPRYRTAYFSHSFNNNGYSAGYYSYLWSEVLDADSVEWFKSHGGLKRENGDHFRKTILSKGGSEEAMGLFRKFMGRDPQIGPLLKRRGLEADDAPPPAKK